MEIDKLTTIIVRKFDATSKQVWNAWISPELLAEWFNTTPGEKIIVKELDLKIGGRFVLHAIDKNGKKYKGEYTGIYTKLIPQKEMIFAVLDTWVAQEGNVKVIFGFELTEENGQTTMNFKAYLPDNKQDQGTNDAWNQCFDNLERILEKRR